MAAHTHTYNYTHAYIESTRATTVTITHNCYYMHAMYFLTRLKQRSDGMVIHTYTHTHTCSESTRSTATAARQYCYYVYAIHSYGARGATQHTHTNTHTYTRTHAQIY